MTAFPSSGHSRFPCWLAVAGFGLASGLLGKPIAPSGLALFPSLVAPATLQAPAEVLRQPQFESVPAPLPANIDSVVFAATGTSEMGDLVRLDGISHFIGSVAVTLTSGAVRANYAGSSPLGFSHPITLTIYAVDRDGASTQPGAILARVSETFLIPWRAEMTPHGVLPARAFTISFDLAALGVALPAEVVYGISINTAHHGPAPIGLPGPYDFLGMGVTDRPVGTGYDVEPNTIFWRSAYGNDESSGSEELRADEGWLPYKPAVRFTQSPYGVLFDLSVKLDSWRGPDRHAASAVNLAASLMALALDRSLWHGNAELQPVIGRYTFDLLAEAVEELAVVAWDAGSAGDEAHDAIDTILIAVESIAQSAVADAIIFSGNVRRVLRAQSEVDLARDNQDAMRHGVAIDHFGAAWQHAQAALQ